MGRIKASVGLFLACVLPVCAQSVEPKAGTWKTWVISSGKDFRVPPPPDAAHHCRTGVGSATSP